MIPLLVVSIILLGIGYFSGLPIPVGYDRGKIKWSRWCKTGKHSMIVYRTEDRGFSGLHPKDRTGEGV